MLVSQFLDFAGVNGALIVILLPGTMGGCVILNFKLQVIRHIGHNPATI